MLGHAREVAVAPPCAPRSPRAVAQVAGGAERRLARARPFLSLASHRAPIPAGNSPRDCSRCKSCAKAFFAELYRRAAVVAVAPSCVRRPGWAWAGGGASGGAAVAFPTPISAGRAGVRCSRREGGEAAGGILLELVGAGVLARFWEAVRARLNGPGRYRDRDWRRLRSSLHRGANAGFGGRRRGFRAH